MRKFFKTSILLLIVASMVLSLFACGDKASTGKEGNGGKEAEDKLFLDPNKYKGKTIVFTSEYLPNDEEWEKQEKEGTSTVEAAKALPGLSPSGRKAFEDATGATVISRPTPAGENYNSKIVAEVSAGMGADLLFLGTECKPAWMVKNILAPLSDYIDFSKPYYNDESRIGNMVKEYYTWGGKVYGMYFAQDGCRVYYNKEKFQNAGLEDPLELWKEDKWTWEKFWEVGQALTADSDGDGVTDQWGHISWIAADGFMASNNVDYIIYDENGMPKFGLDEKYARAQQAADDTINKYKMTPSVWWDPNPQERMWNGESAMDYWGYWELPNMYANMADKLGMVPFPRGPDLPSDIRSRDRAELRAWGLSSASKEPELACLYLEWLFEGYPEYMKSIEPSLIKQYGSKEMYELSKEWNKNGFLWDVSGFGQGFADAMALITGKPGDKSWIQAIEENREACQKAIDDALVNMK